MSLIPIRYFKYVIGFSVALIAVSNSFNVLSDSSRLPVLRGDDKSSISAARPDQLGGTATALLNPNREVSRASGNARGFLVSQTGFATAVSLGSLEATPFAPAITATKSHTPAGSANPGDTLTYSVVITNSGSSDATGVSFTDTIDPNTTLVPGSVKASPIAADDSYHTIGNVNISVPVAQGVTANDSNSGTGTLSVTKVNATVVPGGGSATTSTANGSVTMNSDGSFTYTPNVAFRGPSDSFTYTLDNGSGSTDTATVTISVNGLIWFVNSAAAPGGDGRLSSPFNCLVGAGCFDPAAADAANDNIFVYSGGYTGGLTLLSGQKLIGQGASQSLLTITGLTAPSGNNLLPATGGANPSITSAANGVNVGSNDEIWGVTFGNSPGAAIAGSGFGTLKIRDTTINNGNGPALNLTTSGTLDAIFQSIASTNSASTSINLNTVGGSLTSPTTTVTNPAGIGIQVQGAPVGASINFGNTAVNSSGNSAVVLTSNSGNIAFSALNISPVANQRGVLATENAGTITTTSGAISTTGAPAVEITRTTGTTPLVISLTSVSANGGTSGIVLTNTSGSFTVVGDGTNTNNASGGTIQNSTNNGITLSNAQNISLTAMNIQSTAHSGIKGSNNVQNFSFVKGTINNSGTASGTGDSNIAFDSGAYPPIIGTEKNLTGAVTITGSTLTNAFYHGVDIYQFDGTITNANISNNTISSSTSTATSKGDGIRLVGFGSAATVASITKGTLNQNTITNFPSDAGIFLAGGNATSTAAPAGTYGADSSNQIAITNNIVSGQSAANRIGTQGINVVVNGKGVGNFNIAANAITNVLGNGIGVSAFGLTTVTATVTGNTIVANNQFGSQGIGGGTGRTFANSDTPTLNIKIGDGTVAGKNSISQTDGNGILMVARTSTGKLNVRILSNVVSAPTDGSGTTYGIRVDAGNNTSVDDAACLDITGNVTAGSDDGGGTVAPGIGLRKQGVNAAINDFGIVGLPAGSTTSPNVENYVNSQNPGSAPGTFGTGGTALLSAQSGFSNCSEPVGLSVTPDITASSAGTISDSAESPDIRANLTAHNGPGNGKGNSPQLSQQGLMWMAQAAIQRWREAGLSAEDLARLESVTFQLERLPAGELATIAGTTVKIDETAAGYGWYFDETPNEDSEFDVPVLGRERQATEFSPAFDRIDLLSVIARELGTIYLQGKDRVPKPLRWMMQPLLPAAARRMPVFNITDRSTSSIRTGAGQSLNARTLEMTPAPYKADVVAPTPAVFNPSADLMPGSYGLRAKRMGYAASARRVAALSSFSGETVNLSIGTIPAGKSVTIMFQVTINNPFPNGVCNVTNQGHVTGSNFSQVDTNSDVTPINKAVTISACPLNITTNTGAGVCTAVVTFTTPTSDGCPAPTVTCSPASGFAFPKGTTTVTCTATNGTPPDATCTFTVTVNDAQAPTITCPANVSQGTDAGVCTAAVTYSNATATDNCPGVGTPVCTPASGTTFNKGTTTVTCTVSDASSNSANCSFTVTVNDTTPPTISCPANVVKSTDPNVCNAVVTYPNATATDNCPGVGTPVCSPSSGSTFVKGTTTVTCTVSDASGNPASCSFTVTVNDTQAPSIACPSNVTQSTDANLCSAVVTYSNATATDNCPGVGTPVCTPASGTTFAKGITTVSCTVSDASGNPASCSFTVTINDMQAPTITCPGSVAQGTDAGQCTAVVNYANATASDNCSGVGTPACSPASGSVFSKGTTTVTCSVSDASGNSASCSFSVTVNDQTPPTISCPANVIQSTDPNKCTAVVTYPNATASDACSGVGTPVCSPSSGSTFAIGVTTVTCTVSDASGNPASCSFTVTVRDTQAPTMTACPSSINVTSGGGCQVVNYTSPTATDNCGSAAVVCSPASGFCFPPGTTTVTCTASDTSPYSPDTSCSFTVTVVPCAITCPSNISVGNNPGQCGATVTYSPNTNGGCGTIVCSPSSGSFFPVGTTTVMCTTTAGPGCSFTVTVNDTEGPHITVTTQPIELWPPNHEYHTITMSDLVASATDNCSGNLIGNVVIASVSSDEPENGGGDGNTFNDIVIAGNCKSVQLRAERQGGGNGRVYTIVLTVKDAAGNVGTASRTVTVPLSQGSGPAILGPGPGYSVTGTCP